MTTMVVEIYEALKAAGAPEDKAQLAATVLANKDSRFDQVDLSLVAVRKDIEEVKSISPW